MTLRTSPHLPTVSATGFAKGHSGKPTEIGPNDRFGEIRPGGFVLTVVASDAFTLGTIQIRNDHKARRFHNIPGERDVPPHLIHRDVYGTLLEAARAMSRGPAMYDAVEMPSIDDTENAITGLYRRHLIIDPHDEAQAVAWQEAVMGAAEILGLGVEDARKLKVVEALMAVSDVHDSAGKVNLERASLVIHMVERLLRERRDDITVKRWRMSQNQVSITTLLSSLVALVETMDRVAFQAFVSDPLTGNPGMPVRQDNAVRFWRQHATDLRRIQVRPFGNWFFAMSTVLDRAANAMETGDIDAVLVNMQRLQAIAAVAKARMATERVLAPVAEMRDISRRSTADVGRWRTFSESWAAIECEKVHTEWRDVHGPKATPLSRSGTADKIGESLGSAHAALKLNDLEGAYSILRETAKMLERNIQLG